MSRSASESSCVVVPSWGMQLPPPHAGEKAATGMLVGTLNVEFAGVTQSTWNFHIFRLFESKFRTKVGEPTGGNLAPSRSAESRPPYAESSWTHCCQAGPPMSICDRSKAHARATTNVVSP